MHVLMLLTQSLDSPGGSGRFLPIARAFHQQGVSVTILALHHNIAELDEREQMIDGIRVRYVAQMHVKKVGNEKLYFGTKQLMWRVLIATLKLTWYALRTPCDAIQICKPQPMNVIAGVVSGQLKRKSIFLDTDDWEAENNQFGGAWQRQIVASFENGVRHWMAGISAGTTFIAEQYRRMGYPDERIIMLPNGVDRGRFTPLNLDNSVATLREQWGVTADTPLVMFIGSLSMVHAVDLLIDAFATVYETMPSARLMIVGGGENYGALQAQVVENRLEGAVIFTGRVRPDEVAPYYHLADVTVDPLKPSIEAESSLSLKLLESIACCVPVITTDMGDRAAVANGAAVIIPAGDRSALSNALIDVLTSPELRVELRSAAMKMRESLFWDKRIEPLINLFEQV